MSKKIPDLAIFFALFILPLLHFSPDGITQTRTTWSGLAAISVACIVFFIASHFRVHKFFSPGTALLLAIGFSSFFLATYPAHALTLYIVILTALLVIAVQRISKKHTHNTTIITVMILGMCSLYAQWGIAQFIVQQDLGLLRIGESVLDTTTPGIASFYVGKEKFIRAYGPFGHANSFGGALLLGILLVYRYARRYNAPLFLYGIFSVLGLGILVSFSRTAIAGLLMICALLFITKWRALILPLLVAGLLFTPLVFHRATDTHGAAAQERITGVTWFTKSMTPEVLLRGFGLGNYPKALSDYLTNNQISHNAWEIAPIHSVPLLLIAELGAIISIILFTRIAQFVITHRAWTLVALAPALFLDHYFATQLAPLVFLIICARLVVQ